MGLTEFSRESGRRDVRLAVEAAATACTDAGLPTTAVDGIVRFPVSPTAEDMGAGVGLSDVSFTGTPHLGGASTVAGLRLAALAIGAGAPTCVLVFVARNGRWVSRVERRVEALLPGQRYAGSWSIRTDSRPPPSGTR